MMNETIVTKRRCPSCGKSKILSDENTGELFCGSCGFVITEKIEDTGAELEREQVHLLPCTIWDFQQ